MKPIPHYLAAFTLTFFVSAATAAQAGEYTSKVRTTDVLELFTSEGCSSCPPADRWFTTLKDKSDVFDDFIPLAFHVDYWNYLGWNDRFASSDYSDRQRRHVAAGNVRQSYTPGVVLNGEEWRGHLRGVRQWDAAGKRAGILKAVLGDDNKLAVNFSPASADYFSQQELTLNVAYLGMGLETAVKRGENAGRTLRHDFVVLHHHQERVDAQAQKWRLQLGTAPDEGQQQTAIAVWLSEPDTQKIIQATGGYL
ncbi:MAG: DUF1223 domain-containing protein [Thiolinea sp.]